MVFGGKNVEKEIYLAGGCFWGLEAYLQEVEGVVETCVGYANGDTQRPTYEQVCHQHTGHAETVRVRYDAQAVTLPFLLELFFNAIDPTSVDRQGNDVGNQYRSGVYYTDAADAPIIARVVTALAAHYSAPIAVEVAPLRCFYPAEAYHQQYLKKHPDGYCHISPAQFARARAARDAGAMRIETDERALRQRLSPLQYAVTRQGGTEPPFHNAYWNHDAPGIYVDVISGEPLFSSLDKFDAPCGWPSFTRPVVEAAVAERMDYSHNMVRSEVRTVVSDAHLGHVFDDGPLEKGGKRYCINSAALRFVPKEEMAQQGYGELLSLFETQDA